LKHITKQTVIIGRDKELETHRILQGKEYIKNI